MNLTIRRIRPQARAIVSAIAIALLPSACATAVGNLPPAPAEPPVDAGPAAPLPPYKLQVGDVLDIKFLLNPELNEQVTVRPDGMISTTVAENVPAYGHTPSQVSAELRKKYASDLKNPRLNVVVRSFAPNRIYVGGEVANPGEFISVGPNLTVSQAIARAGGIKLSGDRDRVFIIRRSANGKPLSYSVDYKDVISGAHPEDDVRLAQYDVVYVPRTGVSEVYTFWNQFVQQFVPFNWGFSYQVNPRAR